MSDLNTKLEYLQETKNLIKQSIINKGVSVSDSDTFRSYSNKIDSITSSTEPSWLSEVTNFNSLFANSKATSIILDSVSNTTKLTSLYRMFGKCFNLKSVDLSNLNTANVTNMEGLFFYCTALKNVTLGNFNTSNVTNMAEMFNNCRNLSELDLNSFDVSKVTSMSMMFVQSGLVSLDISSWNTNSLTNSNNMFYQCTKLQSINMKNFNPNNITSNNTMFGGVPTTVKIITNQTMADWLNTNFPDYTNIEIVTADWEG